MKIERDNVPKFLLEIESKISENCRDWLVAVYHESNTYWLSSKDYAGLGLITQIAEQLKNDFVQDGRPLDEG